MPWPDHHADVECCDLTTTGRRTGRRHEIEIWFGVDGPSLYLISGNGPTADWYRNLMADPVATVRIDGVSHAGRARPVTDATERRRVGELMGAKYVWGGDPSIGLTYEAWCFDVPAVGPATLRIMAEVGASALAVEAGRTILLERDELIAVANAAGIAVEAIDPEGEVTL